MPGSRAGSHLAGRGRAGSGRQWTAESGDQAAVRAGSQRQRGSDGVGDVLDQRESQTEAPSAGGGSGVRAAVEGFDQLSGFLAAQWWTVVGHLDPYLRSEERRVGKGGRARR